MISRVICMGGKECDEESSFMPHGALRHLVSGGILYVDERSCTAAMAICWVQLLVKVEEKGLLIVSPICPRR